MQNGETASVYVLRIIGGLCTILIFVAVLAIRADDSKNNLPSSPKGPLSPPEELATFKLPDGFRAELVACEPDVVDPVAIAFDEAGRLYVAEMRGYPNAGVGTGKVSTGKIKLLEDRDGDGFYEHCTTFADGLRFPTSVMPWKGGLLVAVAPDIRYYEDTIGDGKSHRERTLYTGFGLDNIQQMINGLQWALDNWVYGCAGINPSSVRSVERPDHPPVVLRGRHVRFHPESPGSLEPTSGGGQFGLAADDWGQWFTNTNNQHLRHIVIPDHYLQRNPALAVSAVMLDIPDHGPACKVYRISPFEDWRVERTRRRREGPDAKRFPSTELVPGGYITSSCSPVIYTADLFPEAYWGNSFICDPANNLVHRDILVEHGATFVAKRAEEGREFLASTDNWFRPVNLTVGPDGALYVVDFYREVIETPLSLPEDIKRRLNLESRGRGRIWRIVTDKFKRPKPPALRKASTEELVDHLANPNSWWRLTAQRILIEKQDTSAVKHLTELAQQTRSPVGRIHALWTLHGLQRLDDALVQAALSDREAGVREQAIRLAEERLSRSDELRNAVVRMADDPSPRVRFQVAFTLGEAHGVDVIDALAKIARGDLEDPWTQIAVLSSCRTIAGSLLESLAGDAQFIRNADAARLQFLTRLANLVGARAGDAELARALGLLAKNHKKSEEWQIAILTGLGQGMENSKRPMASLWSEHPPELEQPLSQARRFFEEAAVTAQDTTATIPSRISAIRLLGYGPFPIASRTLPNLLSPQNPSDIQLAGVRALSLHNDRTIAEILLASWAGYSPAVRREVLEGIFARGDRLRDLLKAMVENKVLAGQIEPFRLDQLRKHSNRDIRTKALALLTGQVAADRQKIVDSYRPALDLKSDTAHGKAVFKRVCATCHRLENEGTEVGPDLLSALKTKTAPGLLVDIFDPSREVDPRFINYVVINKAGRLFSGIIAAETASSVTLRRAERLEDTILRDQIEEIQASAKSLMPEDLEKQLNQQDVADLIAYLIAVASMK
jgi:putative membrane-bound dehydrogenase-like protein